MPRRQCVTIAMVCSLLVVLCITSMWPMDPVLLSPAGSSTSTLDSAGFKSQIPTDNVQWGLKERDKSDRGDPADELITPNAPSINHSGLTHILVKSREPQDRVHVWKQHSRADLAEHIESVDKSAGSMKPLAFKHTLVKSQMSKNTTQFKKEAELGTYIIVTDASSETIKASDQDSGSGKYESKRLCGSFASLDKKKCVCDDDSECKGRNCMTFRENRTAFNVERTKFNGICIPKTSVMRNAPNQNDLCSKCSAQEVERLHNLTQLSDATPPSFDRNCMTRYKHNQSVSIYQDKVNVKKVIQSVTPALKFANTYGVINVISKLDKAFVGSLPADFIVKGSHGSGMVLFVSKRNSDVVMNCLKQPCKVMINHTKATGGIVPLESLVDHLRVICSDWLAMDFGKKRGEPSYSRIQAACLFEEKLKISNELSQLSVMMFHNSPLFVIVDGADGYHATESGYFTPGGDLIPASHVVIKSSNKVSDDIFRPVKNCWDPLLAPAEGTPIDVVGKEKWAETLKFAEILSGMTGNSHVRVDFNRLESGDIVFAELTFTTSACYQRFIPLIFDRMLGTLGDRPFAFGATCLLSVVDKLSCDPQSPYAFSNVSLLPGGRSSSRTNLANLVLYKKGPAFQLEAKLLRSSLSTCHGKNT